MKTFIFREENKIFLPVKIRFSSLKIKSFEWLDSLLTGKNHFSFLQRKKERFSPVKKLYLSNDNFLSSEKKKMIFNG